MSETISDIVREMRAHESGDAAHAFYSQEAWRQLCDRIEAAATEQIGADADATMRSANRIVSALNDEVAKLRNELAAERRTCERLRDALESALDALNGGEE